MSIEDPRISATASENVSHDFRQDIHEDASIEASAREGVEVAQADNSQQPEKSDRVPAAPQVVAANAHPTEIVPDQNNVAHLPADVAIDDIRVEGNNLVLVQADGTEIVIVNGALHVPTFLLGEVELPQQAVIAALEQSNINVAAGPDGSYTASAGAPSSGADFQDAIQPDPNDPLQLAQLLADTQQADPGLGERRELFDDQPTILADRTTSLSLTETEGEEGGFETQSMNGTFGFDGGANVGQITAVQFFDSLNMNEGTNTGSHVDLMSDGKLVVITVNGLTITGSVDGQPVFVLTVTNTATGAFTFTQFAPLDHPDKGEAGLDDILRLQFSYTVTDKDGDAVTGIASVDINDGGPSIGDAVSPSAIDESDLLSGEGSNASVENVSLGIHWGADAGEHRDLTFSNVQDQLSGLKSDGQTVQFEISADGHTLTGFVGEGEGRTEVFVVTLDPKAANGAYSFTLLQPLDHPQNSETGNTQLGLSFNFVASDADGDTANGSFAVDVNDDVPTAAGTGATVTEAAGAQGAFIPQTATGNLDFHQGADGAQVTNITYRFDTAVMEMPEKDGEEIEFHALTSNGKQIVVTTSADGLTVTGKVGDVTIFTLHVTDPKTGAYTFTQTGPIDHPDKNDTGASDTLRMVFDFTVTDGDGDKTAWNEGTLTIDVRDDGPTASFSNTVTVTEAATDTGAFAEQTANGTLVFKPGADGAEVTNITYRFGTSIMEMGEKDGEKIEFHALTSNGKQIVVTTSADGLTVIGKVGDITIFTLHVTDAKTGAYTFTQTGPIDHPDKNEAGASDSLRMVFDFTVTDGDGDTATNAVQVDIRDDAPTASFSAVTVTEAVTSTGAFAEQTATGTLVFKPGADGAQVTNITYRFDTAVMEMPEKDGEEIEFHALTSNGNQIVVTTSADGLTVTGKVGDVTIFTLHVTDPKTGAYTFTQSGPIDHPDKNDTGASDTLRMVFDFTVTDGDGDKTAWNEGTLTIDINDDGPTISGVAQAANLLANGNFKDDGWQQQNWDNGGYAGSATGGIGWKVEGTGGTVQLERVSNGYLGMKTSNGAPMVDMGSSPGNTTISQDVVGLKAGETLSLSFEVGSPDTGSAKLLVYWNDQLVGTFDQLSQMKLVTIEGLVASDTGSNQLTFKEVGASDYTGTYLANISLTESANVPVFKAEIDEDSKAFSFELAAGKQFSFGADGKGAVALGAATVASASGIALALPAEAYSYKDGHIVINSNYVQSLNAGEIATITIPFTVTDFDGDSKTGVYQITVTGENDAATITGTVTGAVTEDASVLTASGKLDIADVDHGEAHFQAPASLAGTYGTFSFNTATGEWTYALDNAKAQVLGQGKTYDEKLTVVSADGTATQTITVKVNGVNDNPVAVADTNTATEAGVGTSGDWLAQGNVLTNDADADAGDTKTVVGVVDAENHHGVSGFGGFAIEGKYGYLVLGSDGKYLYTLNNFDADTQALKQDAVVTEVFTYTMKDASGATSSATLTISITGTNDAPIAWADVSKNVVVEDGVLAGHANATGNVLTNDTDIDSDGNLKQVVGIASGAKFGSVSGGVDTAVVGKYGSITLDKDGNWTYTLNNSDPDTQSLKKGETGKDVFTYTMTDAHGATSTTTLTIEIRGANDAPTITVGPISNELTEQGTDVQGTATATVKLAIGDVDDDDKASYNMTGWTPKGNNTYAMETAHGTVTLNTKSGEMTFVLSQSKSDSLNINDTVTDSVTVTVKDQNGASTSKTVDFTIHGSNDAAVITGKAADTVTEAGGVNSAQPGIPTATGELNATDVDNSAAFDVKTNVATSYGHFSITAGGVWTYTLNNSNSDVQKLNTGSTPLHDLITVTTADGTTKVIDITINGANDAAVLSSDVVELKETDAVRTAGGQLTITDVDSPQTFTPATVAGQYGSLVILANGTWTYTASSAHNEFVKDQIYTDVFKVASADGTETSVTIKIVGTNDDPVISSGSTASVAENTSFVMKLTSNDVDGGTPSYQVVGGKDGSLFTVDKDGNLVFKTAPNYENPNHPNWYDHSNTYEVVVKADDGKGGFDYQTIKVSVTNVNEAPVLSPETRTVTYEENDSGVRLLSNATLSDPDFPSNFDGGSIKVELGGAVSGDKLILANDGFVRLSGSNVQVWHSSGWQTVGTVSGIGGTSLTISLNNNADRNDVETVLRSLSFTSTSDDPTSANRTATITFNDGGNDGSGSSLSDSSTITIHVDPCNDDPVITSNGGGSYASISVDENQTSVTTVTSQDPDGGSPIYSILKSSGTDWSKFAIDASGKLVFASAPDHENPQDGYKNNTYVVDVQVSDGHGGYDIQRLMVTVNDVNEAPVLNPATTAASYAENGSGVYLMPTATLSDPDKPTHFSGGFISVALDNAQAGDKLIVIDNSSVKIVGTDVKVYQGYNNWQTVGTISGEDTTSLKITLNSNADNADVEKVLQSLGFASSSENPGSIDRTATVTFNDGGHDGSGGALQDSSVVTIHVTPVNDAPSGTNGTVTTAEDTSYALKASDFGFTDVDGNALAAVKISTLPTAGTLYLNNVAVTQGALINVGEINAGHLVFVPAANANGSGYASLTFQVQDDGGKANGGADLDQSPNTLTINVTPVNDAPTASSDVLSNVAEDSGPRSISFAALTANDSAGPNESGQTLTITAVGNAVGGTVAIVDGKVVFTPADNFNGQASFDYTVQDNGQTNGANDFKSTTGYASFQVTAVNDAPTANSDTLSDIAEDGGPRTISFGALTGNDVSGPANENGQTLTITNVGNAVGGTVAIVGGQVVFTPTANFNGQASFDYTVQDNGQTNGANDFKSTTGHASFNVTPVNDAPETNAAKASGDEDKTIAVTLSGSDIDGTVVSYTITGLPQHGTLYSDAGLHNVIALNGVVSGSTVYFVPDANYNGQATFQYAATDDGGLTDTTPATATITIAAINDAPTNLVDANTAANRVAENAATGTLVGITASSTDVDGDTLTYKLTDSAGGRFTIDGATGVVSVADGSKLDYETATSHSITVEVSDGHGATKTEVFTIGVTDVNEAPVITSGTTGTEAENTAVSNVVYQVAASDPEKGALTYSLSGDDAGLFDISSSGAVTFKASPDFEKPLDAGKDNTYNITVTVKDAGNLTASQAVTITVTDVVEAPVKHDPSGSNATISIIEDVSRTFAVSDFGYSDADGDTFASVVIKSIPSSDDGVLLYGNTAVAVGQVISAADIASGMLVYVPKNDVYGSAGDASFTFSVRDSSGGTDATPNTITLDMGSNYQDDVMKPSDNNFLYGLTGSGSASHASVTGSNSSSDSVELATSSGTKFLTLDIERAGDNLEIGWSTSSGERTLTMLEQFDSGTRIEKFGFDGGGSFAGYSLGTSTYTIANGLTGTNASELIVGSGASETLLGGAGNDLLFGGGGNDILKGGEGNDLLVGGAGNDVFRLEVGKGADTIADITIGQDKIGLLDTGSTVATGAVNFANTIGTSAGAALSSNDFVTRTNVAGISNNDDNRVVLLTSAQTSDEIRTTEVSGSGSPTNNYVVVFNSTTGRGEIWFDSDWSTAGPERVQVATLDSIRSLAALAAINASSFVVYNNATDPIILDLDHNGVALTTLDHGVQFDINADGQKDQIAWTAGTDGILAYDVDGNGKIDNGSEIFSPHFAGGSYVDGLAALSTLDSNHDGKIDAADEAFSKLTVWQDLNHNGITDSGELSSLADHSISSISLDANASNSEINGQSILADGSYTLTDGATGHFVEVAFDTTLGGSENGSAYSLIGSDGDDTLSGNGGMYMISGGAGADTFVLDTDALADVKLADVITDFKASEGDTLDVSKLLDSLLGHEASEAEALASVKTTVSGADTVVSVNANGGWHDVAVLQNVTEAVKILYDDKHDTTTAPHAG